MQRKPVIYKIENTVNGKFYIGSTGCMRQRTACHRIRLRKNTHHCKHLQAAWNKYGEEVFRFLVVEEVPFVEDLSAAEDRWLEEHYGKPHCYNLSRCAEAPMRGRFGELSPNFGVPVSDEMKGRISKSLRQYYAEDPANHPRLGKRHNQVTRKKISEKVREALARGGAGKYHRTEETRQKLSQALVGNACAKGTRRSEEVRLAMSERMKGNSLWLGKSHSEETKLKMGRAIIVTNPAGEEKQYGTITLFRMESGLLIPTVQRALKSGKPLAKGPYKGYAFRYV